MHYSWCKIAFPSTTFHLHSYFYVCNYAKAMCNVSATRRTLILSQKNKQANKQTPQHTNKLPTTPQQTMRLLHKLFVHKLYNKNKFVRFSLCVFVVIYFMYWYCTFSFTKNTFGASKNISNSQWICMNITTFITLTVV